jgi:hypothetical protein
MINQITTTLDIPVLFVIHNAETLTDMITDICQDFSDTDWAALPSMITVSSLTIN